MIIAPMPACARHAPDPTDQPAPYPWDMMPADPRDRAQVLAVAREQGIDPKWAVTDLAPVERLEQRVEELEDVVILSLAGRIAT